MKLNLEVWRQEDAASRGEFQTYEVDGVSEDFSFLEMLDLLNERLESKGERPVVFDHDCREGICGACSMMINGRAHGHKARTTTCQLHMREFKDGDTIRIEPWRAKAFPVVADLMVNRTSFDNIIRSGGFISVGTGAAPEANLTPVAKDDADSAFDAATCIGCGACVAQCPNGAAQLFTAAKVAHLGLLPQGQAQRDKRVVGMVETAQQEEFGSCTNHRECEAACPKSISIRWIARMNRDYLKAKLRGVEA
ncbi:MAG: succinate dehydrogenase/fumarate reductase iron-sulfur subunit [Acidobacteriota bacterium]